MYDAPAITTPTEHSIYLRQHTDLLRQHLLNSAQKSLPKNRALELFDAVDQLCVKVLAGPDVTNLEERLTKQMHCMQREAGTVYELNKQTNKQTNKQRVRNEMNCEHIESKAKVRKVRE
jgi:hypothetical protein